MENLTPIERELSAALQAVMLQGVWPSDKLSALVAAIKPATGDEVTRALCDSIRAHVEAGMAVLRIERDVTAAMIEREKNGGASH
jgi:hypothetical protein